jgi:hypothetical protein
MELAELSREFHRYRAIALDAGNEAINSLRDRIRQEIDLLAGSDFSFNELIEDVFAKVQTKATASMPPSKPARLKAMIIYEVFTYDAAGEIQKASAQSADQEL